MLRSLWPGWKKPLILRSLGVQGEQLLTQRQVFKHEILPGTKSTDNATEKMAKAQDHGWNSIEDPRTDLCASH